MDTTVYLGANHIGLRLRCTTVTAEVKAVVDTGMQYVFQSHLDVERPVLFEALGKSVLPAIMPINVAWLINEFRVMEVTNEVNIPFTDIYPEIEDALRNSLYTNASDSTGAKSD
ncbi:hypothetical protein [Rhodococcus rhodochrous]|uniref:hypothetical protein n=1 Tax=Rhodococcus rhodochrous TaxID=1829 RepID=UPI00036CD97D|nr:hypothetical protein [Rhodococcus rhodochrous]